MKIKQIAPKQLAIEFYKDETITRKPKVGDVILLEQYKYSSKKEKGYNVIVPTLIVRSKDLSETSLQWRLKGRGLINIIDVEHANYRYANNQKQKRV